MIRRVKKYVRLLMMVLGTICFLIAFDMIRQEYHNQTDKQEEVSTETEISVYSVEAQKFCDADNREYTDNYVYSTLDEESKQVYQEIFETILRHEEKVEVSTLNGEIAEQAYRAVLADYGGLFWLSGYSYTQYTRADELIKIEFKPEYTMDYEQRMHVQEQIDEVVNEFLVGISMAASDYKKAKYVFETLVSNVDYDASAEENQNIISVFLNRISVCQGYSCATQYLLSKLGIQSAIVTGNANGESHAWNLVRVDNEYYYMDTTWGDPEYLDSSGQVENNVENNIDYNYMLVTAEEIEKTHTVDCAFSLPEIMGAL